MAVNVIKIIFKWYGYVYKDMLINVDIVLVLYFFNFWFMNVFDVVLLNF